MEEEMEKIMEKRNATVELALDKITAALNGENWLDSASEIRDLANAIQTLTSAF